MKWHFDKNDFLQWCAESGVEVPSELIQPKPRNMKEHVERELERLNSNEPDPMNQLLRGLCFLQKQLNEAYERLGWVELPSVLQIQTKTYDTSWLVTCANHAADELVPIACKLAAELEVRS
jgi:hypothetical protein